MAAGNRAVAASLVEPDAVIARIGKHFVKWHSPFLDEGSIERTFSEIDSIGLKEGEPYYVRMGIAFLLATALAKNENRTRDFVRSSSLPAEHLSGSDRIQTGELVEDEFYIVG